MTTTPRIPARKPQWTEVQLAAWAKSHPAGTPVRYWSVRGYDEHIDTTIRSEPWRLGHGMPVVNIEGVAGGVSLDHLKKIGRT